MGFLNDHKKGEIIFFSAFNLSNLRDQFYFTEDTKHWLPVKKSKLFN